MESNQTRRSCASCVGVCATFLFFTQPACVCVCSARAHSTLLRAGGDALSGMMCFAKA
jgi:hypothetical protein